MSEKQKPISVSGEWSKLAEFVQEDVNKTLESFEPYLNTANQKIEKLFKTDQVAAYNYAQEVVRELDKRWEYFHDLFMVTGKWYYPDNPSFSFNSINCEHYKTEAFKIVRSNGFAANLYTDDNDEDEQHLKVGLSFIITQGSIETGALQGNFAFLAFAQLNEISLQYMRPGTPETVGASAEEIQQAVQAADVMLAAHIGAQYSNFFDVSVNKQGQFLKSVIEQAQQTLPPMDSLDVAIINDAKISSCFARHPISGEIITLGSLNGSPFEFEKLAILDFGTVDTLRDGFGVKHYKSPNELTYSKGLCAVVTPTENTMSLPEGEISDLIVPIKSFKNGLNIEVESPFS